MEERQQGFLAVQEALMEASAAVLAGQANVRDTLKQLAELEGRTHAGIASVFGAVFSMLDAAW